MPEAGHVIHKPSGKKVNYGEVVVDASKLEPPKNVKLKKRSEYKLIGKPLHRQDTPLKTNGAATFGLDKKLRACCMHRLNAIQDYAAL